MQASPVRRDGVSVPAGSDPQAGSGVRYRLGQLAYKQLEESVVGKSFIVLLNRICFLMDGLV